jgi:hypothetical protein
LIVLLPSNDTPRRDTKHVQTGRSPHQLHGRWRRTVKVVKGYPGRKVDRSVTRALARPLSVYIALRERDATTARAKLLKKFPVEAEVAQAVMTA